MNRRSILKRLALAPIMACMATELDFSQPEPKLAVKKPIMYLNGKPVRNYTRLPKRFEQVEFL